MLEFMVRIKIDGSGTKVIDKDGNDFDRVSECPHCEKLVRLINYRY